MRNLVREQVRRGRSRPVASSTVAPRPAGAGAASLAKKFGKVFRTQAGLRIRMPGDPEAQGREAHRDAVVVVGLDLGAVQCRRKHLERVARLDDPGAALRELCHAARPLAPIPAGAAGRGR